MRHSDVPTEEPIRLEAASAPLLLLLAHTPSGSLTFNLPTCREWPVEASQYELLEFAGKGAHAVVSREGQGQQPCPRAELLLCCCGSTTHPVVATQPLLNQ